MDKREMLAVYQKDFLTTALHVGALRFGEFTLKSGRLSPYFFNAGAFCDGEALAVLARGYAELIGKLSNEGLDITALYGPAYKGIPLVTATALSIAESQRRSLPWAFNRKESKDHGEGGVMVGANLKGKKVLIVDDVLTAGTAARESVHLLQNIGAEVVGMVVALDRQETVEEDRGSALDELAQEFGLKTAAIATLDDIVAYIEKDPRLANNLLEMRRYRAQYGIRV